MSHIRNGDLNKMTGKQLQVEAEYLWEQGALRLRQLVQNLSLIKKGVVVKTPTWKLTEDINLITERLQMVMEEIEYRKIP